MSARPDFAVSFRALESLVESQPDGVTGEIARGVFAMSPRARPRHSFSLGELYRHLRNRFGDSSQGTPPDWIFLVDPEIRSEAAYSRLVPDVAGWRKSTTGWPAPDDALIELMPEWVAEVLSPGTRAFDEGPKKDAYGLMGVGWLWLVDTDAKRIEVLENVRGKMLPRASVESGALVAPPFGDVGVDLAKLFWA